MLLKRLTISGYRGFATSQTLHLAQPNGRPGSGLTVIVGANNAGKSSVIEVLHFLRLPGRNVEFVESHKNARTNGQIRIDYEIEGGAYRLNSSPGGSGTWDLAGC